MAKRKHSSEWMLGRVQEYLSGEGSYETIARRNGIGTRTTEDKIMQTIKDNY